MLRPSIFGEDLFDDFFGEFPFFNDRIRENGKETVRTQGAEPDEDRY